MLRMHTASHDWVGMSHALRLLHPEGCCVFSRHSLHLKLFASEAACRHSKPYCHAKHQKQLVGTAVCLFSMQKHSGKWHALWQYIMAVMLLRMYAIACADQMDIAGQHKFAAVL